MNKRIRNIGLLVVVLAGLLAISGAAYAMTPGGDGPDGEGAGPVGNVGAGGSSETGTGDGAISINTDPLGMDAQTYASDYGVTVEEARRRLTLQGSVGTLQEDLIDDESATFGGLWIQHEPEFRIVARFTQDGESTVKPYVTDKALSGLVDVQTASATLDELKAAQGEAITTVNGLGIQAESEIDVIGNRVKLFVVDRTGLDSSLATPDVELPDEVDIVTVDELSTVTTDLYAGLTIEHRSAGEIRYCTTGFAVIHADGRKGITTAAHCRDGQTFDGTALRYVNGLIGGSYDVQWHEAPGLTLQGLMYDGAKYRVVSATKRRAQQSVGDYVCKYGISTGFGCGNIVSTTFQPADNSGDGCNGCTYSATFIRVRNRGGIDLANGGDSGGPWFLGNTAYGIMRGEASVNQITFPQGVYMAINYVQGLGVAVITE